MLCGLPASGKSKMANNLSETHRATIHSSDALRKELFGDENNNDDNEKLFKELHTRIKKDLESGKNVIYDATNTHHKRRKAFLEEINKYNCKKICYILATPYKKCLEQNTQRNRIVPDYVIKRSYMNFYIPQYYEGWNDIRINWNFDKTDYKMKSLFDELSNINQDNPNHVLTIGDHCILCEKLIKQYMDCAEENIEYIAIAGKFHDIGKKFTKTFTNMKGETTDIAHYYQHHLVSAYDAMFYLKSSGFEDKDILSICNYIQWHMQPYFIETEKQKSKFINLVGEKFYKELMILHKADKDAH